MKLSNAEQEAFDAMIRRLYPGRIWEDLKPEEQSALDDAWRKSKSSAATGKSKDAYAAAKSRAEATERDVRARIAARTPAKAAPTSSAAQTPPERISDARYGNRHVLGPNELKVIDDRLAQFYGRVYDRMNEGERNVERRRELTRLGIDADLPAPKDSLGPAQPKQEVIHNNLGEYVQKKLAAGGQPTIDDRYFAPQERISDARVTARSPGMAALEAGLAPEVRRAVATTFAKDFTDPNGYVPWAGWAKPTAEDILHPKLTSDSAATADAEEYRRNFPSMFEQPPTPEEIERKRTAYAKDKTKFDESTRKWQERKDKAAAEGKPFADPPPARTDFPGLEGWTPDPAAPDDVAKATFMFKRSDYEDKPTSWVRSVNAVANEMKNLRDSNPGQIAELAKKMQDAGLLDEVYDFGDVEKVWVTLTEQAAAWHKARPFDMLTPMDMIGRYKGDTTALGSKGTPGARTVDVVNKTATISTNNQARGMLRAMMARELGRRPTQGEIDDFQGALNKAQRANPEVTKTKTKYGPDGPPYDERNVSRTITPGLDEEDFTFDHVVDNDPDSEYGKYQQATTYFNALLGAMSGPVPQGN